MTKICDIPYPIHNLTKIRISIYGPKQNLSYIKILFQTCVLIGSLVQTNVKLP